MKTIYGRINEIEERLHLAGGGNRCEIACYRKTDDPEPIKVTSYPSEKNVRFKLIVGGGFVPPDFLTK